jgi:dimeric dUTPase (all-alpha-NTP-PPase superfamily)
MSASLDYIFSTQKDFQESLGYNFESMSPEERTAYVKEMSIHLNQEMNEMLYELPFFKPWKDYTDMPVEKVNEACNKAKLEVMDMFHFFINIAIALNVSSDTLITGYFAKNSENKKRQVNGYDYNTFYGKGFND